MAHGSPQSPLMLCPAPPSESEVLLLMTLVALSGLNHGPLNLGMDCACWFTYVLFLIRPYIVSSYSSFFFFFFVCVFLTGYKISFAFKFQWPGSICSSYSTISFK